MPMGRARFISNTVMDAERLSLHYLLLILQLTSCTSMDSINTSQAIKEGDLLISKGNIFALGFFSPGSSSYRYLGIWYHKVPEQTVVWVANRNNPINHYSGVVSFDDYGNLILYSYSSPRDPVWSANVSGEVAHSCVAQLLDSGNFVLVEDGSGRILWQSFDYPTHVHLPGMKLGLDRNTGLERFLTSWRSADDPGIGDYSFKVNPNGSPQFFLYKGTNPWWRTAPWPWKGQRNLYHLIFINNQDEISSSYNVPDGSVIMRKMLDHSGFISVATWHGSDGKWKEFWKAPQFRCDSYGKCGAYSICQSADVVMFECACLPGYEPKYQRDWFLRDGSGGCVRKRLESSSVCGQGEGFVKVENVFLPDTSAAVWMDMSTTRPNCELECKRNCSCSAYSIIDIPGNQSGCLTWYGELMDIISDREERSDLYIRVDALELAENGAKSNASFGKEKLTIILVTFVSASLVVSIFAYLWLKKNKRKGNLLANLLGKNSMNPGVEFFKLSTISAATNRFSPANKLGQGGFGIVYMGQLPNEQEVAIKRLSKNSGQGINEFKNEVEVIAKLQHKNLVKLLGYCIQGGEQMLIYEYMPNKDLHSFLFDEARKSVLDWQKRFDIIVGIARGILYLHQDSRLRIIHRDLKCSNILLDAEMNPKISDFGLARIFESDQIQAKTNRVVGTFGYMSPEYAAFGKFSVKSDVFSFGVMLLEIVSGQKNNAFDREDPSLTLIGHVWDLWREDRALEVVDSSLKDLYQPQEALKCIQIGLLCVQEDAMERPSMLAVVFMLNTSETTLPSPKQPAFILKETCNNPQVAVDVAEGGTCSINHVTMTGILSR